MAKYEFRLEDINGKVIHIGDTVEFDLDLAREKHPNDYTEINLSCADADNAFFYKHQPITKDKTTFKVAGFGYFDPLGCPYVYTPIWIPHYVDCCRVVSAPTEDYSFIMETN